MKTNLTIWKQILLEVILFQAPRWFYVNLAIMIASIAGIYHYFF